MKNLLTAICALILIVGCSQDNPSESELLAESKQVGSNYSQRNSLETATVASSTVLLSLGLAQTSDVAASIQSSALKLIAAPGFSCGDGVSANFDSLFEGSMSVAGNCAESDGGSCTYSFAGNSYFNALLLGPPGRILNGSLETVLSLRFKDCNSDLNQATVSVGLSGNANVGDHTILYILASFTVLIDPTSGAISLVPQTLDAIGQFRGLNCRSSLSGSSCFVDADNDLADDDFDNCVNLNNPEQSDSDADGVGDSCDNCPITPNADQAENNEEGRGDACIHICAPGLELCATAADCPAENLCLNGCCQGQCPEAPFVSLSCKQADELNQDSGLEGGCGAFSQECNADGCCQFTAFPEPPADFCNEIPDSGGLCAGPGGSGFCTALLNEVCLLAIEADPVECPPLSDDLPTNVDCSGDFGQRVCNDLITLGIGSRELTCNGVCCVEPSP